MAASTESLNAELDAALASELARVKKDLEQNPPQMSITDRCRIYDRALKREALRLKADDEWGGMFDPEPDEEETPAAGKKKA